jgi:hypothetical protein
MKSKLLVIVLSVLLIASITTNIILLTKLNTNKTDNNVSDTTTETDTTSDLIGVYYNANNGTIEIKSDNKCMYKNDYNKDCTYSIKDNKITFTYYTDVEKDTDNKCYNHYSNGDKVETSCKETHNIKGTIVNNGIIIDYNNGLYSKVS